MLTVSISARMDRPESGEGIRLAITRSDGNERAAVMYPRPEEEKDIG